MVILFLKRGLILGVFFAFFFFACENTPFQNYNNQDSKVYNTDDDDDTSRTRTRSRSSSSGSSSGGSSSSRGGSGSSSSGSSSGGSSSGGSSTGGVDPRGPTVSGRCPEADEVARYSPLTTITFKKINGVGGNCLSGRYRHSLYNDGEDDSGRDDSCDYRCDHTPKGSSSPNQNVILYIDSHDPEIAGPTQDIYLNERVVGNLKESSDTFYIYFQRNKSSGSTITKSLLKKTSYRWPTCVCSGQSRPTQITLARIRRSDAKLTNTDICRNNVAKVWLAKKVDGGDCRFY